MTDNGKVDKDKEEENVIIEMDNFTKDIGNKILLVGLAEKLKVLLLIKCKNNIKIV